MSCVRHTNFSYNTHNYVQRPRKHLESEGALTKKGKIAILQERHFYSMFFTSILNSCFH